MERVEIAVEELRGDNPKALALVAGFRPRPEDYKQAAASLNAAGYDVFTYSYDESVFMAGVGGLLPKLLDDLTENFHSKSKGYESTRYAGISAGGGLAWTMQRRAVGPIEPGLYVAAGVDAAAAVFMNPAFRYFTKGAVPAYRRNGTNLNALREAWRCVQEPPDTGFAIAYGGLDYVVTAPEIALKIRKWRRQAKPFAVHWEPYKTHTGMIRWFNRNIPTMLKLADSIEK